MLLDLFPTFAGFKTGWSDCLNFEVLRNVISSLRQTNGKNSGSTKQPFQGISKHPRNTLSPILKRAPPGPQSCNVDHVTTATDLNKFSAKALGRSLLWTLLPFRAPSFSRDNLGTRKWCTEKMTHEMPWNTQRMGRSCGEKTVFHFEQVKKGDHFSPLCSKLHRTQHQLKEIQPRPYTAYGSPWRDLPDLKLHIFRLDKHDIQKV